MAQRAAAGETVPGDAYRVLWLEGTVLITVVDGLGHGPDAAAAAVGFCQVVEADPLLPLDAIAREADQRLVHTRGAVAAIARLDTGTRQLEYLGVGNIGARALSRHPVHPISAPGVVGRRAARLRCDRFQLVDGDLLVLFSDGISNRFELEPLRALGAAELARALLAGFGKAHDDATCVALRCLPRGR